MGTRLSRAERRQQTHQDLVTAAEACFVGRGFNATSVDEVAERAGYTKGALDSNFASKEDLFFAVYQRRVEQVLTEAVSGLRKPARNGHSTGWPRLRSSAATATMDGWRFLRVLGARAAPSRALVPLRGDRCHDPRLADGRGAAAADDCGIALPSDVTATQVALAWNAMEVGLGLQRLTQPQTVDVVLARRMVRLLLDAAFGAT